MTSTCLPHLQSCLQITSSIDLTKTTIGNSNDSDGKPLDEEAAQKTLEQRRQRVVLNIVHSGECFEKGTHMRRYTTLDIDYALAEARKSPRFACRCDETPSAMES